jgi:hypothetical protein
MSAEHPPTAPKKGTLRHEHRGAAWQPTACTAHREKPCPKHELDENGAAFEPTCEACQKVRQPGHQPSCSACVETWEATREHMVAVQVHEERAERLAAGAK